MKAVKLAKTKNMEREEWLELRKMGCGGSDASAIVGVNPYKSQYVAYFEKTGQYSPKPAGEAAEWGTLLEPVIRKRFVEKVNEERDIEGKPHLRVQQCHYLLQHPEYKFMLANVDGLISCPILGKGILEIKTANQYLSDEWSGDDIPNNYFIQIQHYLAVTGLNFAFACVLIGGQKFKKYFIQRDQEFIDTLITLEKDFWENHVVPKIPPEMDGSDSTKDMINDLYGKSDPDAVPLDLPLDLIEQVLNLENIKETEKQIQNSKQKSQNILKEAMGQNEIAFIGPHQVTWKSNKNGVRSFKYKLGKEVG